MCSKEHYVVCPHWSSLGDFLKQIECGLFDCFDHNKRSIKMSHGTRVPTKEKECQSSIPVDHNQSIFQRTSCCALIGHE